MLGSVAALLSSSWPTPVRAGSEGPVPSGPPTIPGTPFASGFGGFFTDLGISSSHVGYGAVSELGARTLGIRSLAEDRWLLQWDLSLSAAGGVLGSSWPVTPLAGGVGRIGGELDYRLQPRSGWSPQVGLGGRTDVRWLVPPGSRRYPLNDTAGVGGFETTGRVRAGLGASYLDVNRSFVLLAFAEEALRPTTRAPHGVGFTGAGVELRYDAAQRFMWIVEASWGKAALMRDLPLGFTDRTTRVELATEVRTWVSRRSWIGLGAVAARNSDRIVYSASQRSYDTADVPYLSVTISYGFAPGGR